LQSFLSESSDLLGVFDDVDLFAAQLADDGLHTHSLHADAGADRVDILVAAHDSDLGALTSLASDGADSDGAVVDLRNFALKKILDQRRSGAGDDHLRPLGGAVHTKQNNADAFTDGELLEAGLLAFGHAGFRLAEVEDHIHGLETLDRRRDYFTGAVVVLVENGVSLGFANFLKDDLFSHLGGDAPERGGVFVEAEFAADLDLRREFTGLLKRHLIDVILDLIAGLDHGFVDVGADLASLTIHLCAHVLLRLVILAGSQGDGILNGANNNPRLDSLIPA